MWLKNAWCLLYPEAPGLENRTTLKSSNNTPDTTWSLCGGTLMFQSVVLYLCSCIFFFFLLFFWCLMFWCIGPSLKSAWNLIWDLALRHISHVIYWGETYTSSRTSVSHACLSVKGRIVSRTLSFYKERKQGGEKTVRKKLGKSKSQSLRKREKKKNARTNPPASCSQFPLRLRPSRAHSATTIQCFPSL